MKNTYKRYLVGLGFFSFFSVLGASFTFSENMVDASNFIGKPTLNEYGELTADIEQQRTLQVLLNSLREKHIIPFRQVDKEQGVIIFNEFISLLDPDRSTFLSSDLQGLEKYKEGLYVDIKDSDLSFPYSTFSLYDKRRQKMLLEMKKFYETVSHDYILKEELLHNRDSESDPFQSKQEAYEHWKKIYKVRVLKLMAEGADVQSAINDTLSLINNQINYYQIADKELIFTTFANVMLSLIEPHTYYNSASRMKRFEEEMNNKMSGIGAVLYVDDYVIKVSKVLIGGPAYKQGAISKGDSIIAVENSGNWVNTTGMRLSDVTDLIKGDADTIVRLRIVKKDNPISEFEEIQIKRSVINAATATINEGSKIFESNYYVTNNNVGIIALPSFYHGAYKDVSNNIEKLKKEGVDGIMLDLRGNGGGSLYEAQNIASLFLDGGVIVYTKGDAIWTDELSDNTRFNSGSDYSGPLAVLIDRNSASASEIVAGALKDHNRALVLGETSYGKGTVQGLYELNQMYSPSNGKYKIDGGIAITHAMFYRPNGISTQKIGVKPHITLFDFDDTLWGETAYSNAIDNKILEDEHNLFRPNNEELSGLQELQEYLYEITRNDDVVKYFNETKKPNKGPSKPLTLSLEHITSKMEKDKESKLKAINIERAKEGLSQFDDMKSAMDTDFQVDVELGYFVKTFDKFIDGRVNNDD